MIPEIASLDSTEESFASKLTLQRKRQSGAQIQFRKRSAVPIEGQKSSPRRGFEEYLPSRHFFRLCNWRYNRKHNLHRDPYGAILRVVYWLSRQWITNYRKRKQWCYGDDAKANFKKNGSYSLKLFKYFVFLSIDYILLLSIIATYYRDGNYAKCVLEQDYVWEDKEY